MTFASSRPVVTGGSEGSSGDQERKQQEHDNERCREFQKSHHVTNLTVLSRYSESTSIKCRERCRSIDKHDYHRCPGAERIRNDLSCSSAYLGRTGTLWINNGMRLSCIDSCFLGATMKAFSARGALLPLVLAVRRLRARTVHRGHAPSGPARVSRRPRAEATTYA